MCMVARRFCSFCWIWKQNCEYIRGLSPDRRQSSRYSVHRSFLVTPFFNSSLRMYSKSGIRFSDVSTVPFGYSMVSSTLSVKEASSGHLRPIASDLLRIRDTVLRETSQLSAIFRSLIPRLNSLRISRYLVIVLTLLKCICTIWRIYTV